MGELKVMVQKKITKGIWVIRSSPLKDIVQFGMLSCTTMETWSLITCQQTRRRLDGFLVSGKLITSPQYSYSVQRHNIQQVGQHRSHQGIGDSQGIGHIGQGRSTQVTQGIGHSQGVGQGRSTQLGHRLHRSGQDCSKYRANMIFCKPAEH